MKRDASPKEVFSVVFRGNLLLAVSYLAYCGLELEVRRLGFHEWLGITGVAMVALHTTIEHGITVSGFIWTALGLWLVNRLLVTSQNYPEVFRTGFKTILDNERPWWQTVVSALVCAVLGAAIPALWTLRRRVRSSVQST